MSSHIHEKKSVTYEKTDTVNKENINKIKYIDEDSAKKMNLKEIRDIKVTVIGDKNLVKTIQDFKVSFKYENDEYEFKVTAKLTNILDHLLVYIKSHITGSRLFSRIIDSMTSDLTGESRAKKLESKFNNKGGNDINLFTLINKFTAVDIVVKRTISTELIRHFKSNMEVFDNKKKDALSTLKAELKNIVEPLYTKLFNEYDNTYRNNEEIKAIFDENHVLQATIDNFPVNRELRELKVKELDLVNKQKQNDITQELKELKNKESTLLEQIKELRKNDPSYKKLAENELLLNKRYNEMVTQRLLDTDLGRRKMALSEEIQKLEDSPKYLEEKIKFLTNDINFLAVAKKFIPWKDDDEFQLLVPPFEQITKAFHNKENLTVDDLIPVFEAVLITLKNHAPDQFKKAQESIKKFNIPEDSATLDNPYLCYRIAFKTALESAEKFSSF